MNEFYSLINDALKRIWSSNYEEVFSSLLGKKFTDITTKSQYEEIIDSLEFNVNDIYAAVMTHSHAIDHEIVKSLAKKPLKYKGVIASKSKWESFKKKYRELGMSENEISRIKSPIGIANTGKAPHEIAISIAAEILEIHYAKN